MKKHSSYKCSLLLGVLMGGLFASCSQSGGDAAEGVGNLKLNIAAVSGFNVSRALDESDYRNTANYTVEVLDANNEVLAGPYKATEVPNTIVLPYGSYTVTASYGKETAASRDEFLSRGSATVYLGSGEEKSVTITCAPTCGKCVVKFDPEMATYYDDYSVAYSTKALGTQTANWAKTDAEPWYLLVDEDGEEVKATIRLTVKDQYLTDKDATTGATSEATVVKTYNLKPNKSWTMNIAPNYTSSKGELGITITIDESTNDQEVDVIIPAEWI